MTKLLSLCSNALASKNRFGICLRSGEPIWYGTFPPNDEYYNGEQWSAELETAKRAIWLTKRIKEMLDLTEMKLELFVEVEWLTLANEAKGSPRKSKAGGKARCLDILSEKHHIDLHMNLILSRQNPANRYITCKGFKRHSDGMAVAIESLLDA